ncbi:pupal cuticle protein G1A-like, partial [Contarinia nasturtii]|uniref:pupal cuticle protein G1A-like n=1 Tax=Contarinia nasturtii TaxID=265458 RepID=UPI0012D45F03
PEPYNYHAEAHAYPAAYAPTAYGTISHHGKTIATPHSYVSKYDTRYVHEDPHYYPSATVVKSYDAAPVVAKAVYSPTVLKTPVVPTIVKTPVVSSVPVVKSYDSYGHSYDHSYDHSYAHAAPVIAKSAVSYSPAVAVSHATFESAHGHYAW